MSIKEIICFIGVGLLVGFPIGYFVGNKAAEREYSKEIEKLSDSESKANAKVKAIVNMVDKTVHETETDILDDDQKSIRGESKSLLKEKPTLESLANKYNDDAFSEHIASREHPEDDLPEPDTDLEDEDDILDEDDEDEVIKKMIPPYEIDEIEVNDYPGFTQKHLTYYVEDDILSDETGCMYSDRKDMLGNLVAEALPEIQQEDRIFVANEERQTIYVVIIDYDSSYYKESVKRYV